MNHASCRALGALLVASACLWSGAAWAHQVGLSRGTYRLQGAQLDATIVFQNGELSAAAGADKDRDGALSDAELEPARPQLEETIVKRLDVRGDGQPCAGSLVSSRLVEGDGVEMHARFVCASPPREVVVTQNFLEKLSHGHRQLSSLTDGVGSVDTVTFSASRTLRLTTGSAAPAGGAAPAGAQAKVSDAGKLQGLFLLGIEHILTGYDHLVFLLGLVLVGGRFRSLLAVVTAFTVAHSITLAMAALGVWSPSPRIIEPAIALSIAYVGVENFFVKNAEGRWRITFPFGLIHGFGFAGALAEVALPRAQLPQALLLFNLGVEAGQIAVMLPLLLILAGLRRVRGFERYGVRALSGAVFALGVMWFISRVLGVGA